MTNKKKILKTSYGSVLLLLIGMSIMLLMLGCGKGNDTKIVLTAGFAKDEIFKIDDIKCTIPEMTVYLTNIQNQYENVFGEEIWDTQIDGVTLENNVKEVALSKMAQVKSIVLMARQRGIVLDDVEQEKVEEATDQYYNSLTSYEIETMGIDRETVRGLYEEYALATKVYDVIIKDINPEISDDEARTITVSNILIKTYKVGNGNDRIPYTVEEKTAARNLANEIAERAKNGENFDNLADEYNEGDEITISFRKGEKEIAYETTAFNLDGGEVSNVIETIEGYNIIKCLSTFNREVTDENKIKIVEERKKEVFSEEYDRFTQSVTKIIDEQRWSDMSFIHDSRVTTDDFFIVFDEHFK